MDFRELFYLQKSDRKVLAFLLCLALAVLGAMFLLGQQTWAHTTKMPQTALHLPPNKG